MLTVASIDKKVSFLPENQKKFLKKLIKRSQDDQKALAAVGAIVEIIACVEVFFPDKGQEVLKGAHLVIENRDLSQKLKSDTETRNRISSHYRGQKEEEFGINLQSTADFLVGLNPDCLWLQLENSKVSFEEGIIWGAALAVLHIMDYIQYKITGKNVGPCGLSEYTESNPLKLENVETLFVGQDISNTTTSQSI